MVYYDSLVSRNKLLGKDQIINELENRKGKLFDPSITENFVEFLRKNPGSDSI